jgi:uncharacterized membrane protein YedE/YeeE
MSATWTGALAGGALIGLASGALMLGIGRIAGIAGVFGALVEGGRRTAGWQIAFVAGLLAAGIAGGLWAPQAVGTPAASPLLLVVAGLLVGAGTTLANGCTSGHGVCGLGRFSARSLVAVATFLATGIGVTLVARHMIGGA